MGQQVFRVSRGMACGLLVSGALAILTTPNAASQGLAYTFTMQGSGGQLPYTWTMDPSWASIDPATGIITGTPLTADTSFPTITLTDNLGAHVSI